MRRYIIDQESKLIALRQAELSPRQIQCVGLSVFGTSHRAIANALELSRGSVHTHVKRGREKLAAAGLTLRDLTRQDEPTITRTDPYAMGQMVGVE